MKKKVAWVIGLVLILLIVSFILPISFNFAQQPVDGRCCPETTSICVIEPNVTYNHYFLAIPGGVGPCPPSP